MRKKEKNRDKQQKYFSMWNVGCGGCVCGKQKSTIATVNIDFNINLLLFCVYRQIELYCFSVHPYHRLFMGDSYSSRTIYTKMNLYFYFFYISFTATLLTAVVFELWVQLLFFLFLSYFLKRFHNMFTIVFRVFILFSTVEYFMWNFIDNFNIFIYVAQGNFLTSIDIIIDGNFNGKIFKLKKHGAIVVSAWCNPWKNTKTISVILSLCVIYDQQLSIRKIMISNDNLCLYV